MGRYKGTSISLERKEPMQMDNIMPLFLKAMRLSAGMDVHLVLSAWDKVTGAAPYTLSKFLKDGLLICGISSSVVRNQLFFNRDAIIEEINRVVTSDPLYSNTGCTAPVKSLVLR